MHRRATGFPSSLCRAVGGLAFWLVMAGVLTGAAWQVAAQHPYPVGQTAILSSAPGGFFDPAAAVPGGPAESGPMGLISHLDDSLTPEARDPRPPGTAAASGSCGPPCDWRGWQLLPDGLIYDSYLAGVKEPRLGAAWVYERQQGWFHDVTLGGRVGIVRYGTPDPLRAEGFQMDFEGAVFPRVDGGSLDVVAMDFRYGLPLTFGRGRHRTKLAFYHLSSHLGDEFLLSNPGFPRINYLRDALVLGRSFYWTENLRLYAEAAYGFRVDGGARPWEFQFGIEYARARPTGFRPVPFFALGGHLREEVGFGGNVTVQAGYMWRGVTGNLMRVGLHYFAGKSDQFEFFDRYEDKIGVGLWYDY